MGKFRNYVTGEYTDDAVEEVKGDWFIKLGFAGFNSNANNLWGYGSKKAAESAVLHYQSNSRNKFKDDE